jgi:HAD superfamily hydrolase (TIGR01509 family)
MMVPLPEAVIFDFDGVIVDTEPIHWQAFREVLLPLGIPLSWEEYAGRYMGFDDRDAFREGYRDHGRPLDPETLADLVAAKSRAFQEILRAGVRPFPGAVPLIGAIHSRGIPLAISSGALRSDIDPILDTLGIAGFFAVIVSADDVEKSKPDPASYRLAWTTLRNRFPGSLTVPARSLAIEDTPAGIESAKGAGLSVLAIAGSYRREELSKADTVVDSLEEVRIGS